MLKENSKIDLTAAIERLERKQVASLSMIQRQATHAYESLKPVNLIKKLLKDISSSGPIKNILLTASTGLTSGFLLKKLMVGKSKSIAMKLFGNVVMFGVANFIGRHPGLVIAAKDKFIRSISYNRRKPLHRNIKTQSGEVSGGDEPKSTTPHLNLVTRNPKECD